MSGQIDQSVGGDSDRWVLFNRETSDGYPLVVLARTENPLIDEALLRSIVTVIHCEADPASINDRGMPQNSDRLYPVEEQLARELEALKVEALHIASVTGDGERRIVLTHTAPLNFEPILAPLVVEGYRLRTFEPTDRESLRALITPTALDLQLNGDLGVISNIEKNGDDGIEPRKTDFWFYGDPSNLEQVVTDLEPWGFSVERHLADPQGIVLSCITPVDFATFAELTPVLLGVAENREVIYDGWETLVIKPGDLPDSPPVPVKPVSFLSRLFGAKKN